jgi:hypothetical protein
MKSTIYIAFNKETGSIMHGAKWQYAFGDKDTLSRSVGQNYSYTARQKGVKPKDLYFIKEFVVDSEEPNNEPFVVNEIHGSNWNGEARFSLEVDGGTRFSAGSFSECPEDATLERDLSFVYDIADLLREAYEAGKAGRPLEFKSENEDDEE